MRDDTTAESQESNGSTAVRDSAQTLAGPTAKMHPSGKGKVQSRRW